MTCHLLVPYMKGLWTTPLTSWCSTLNLSIVGVGQGSFTLLCIQGIPRPFWGPGQVGLPSRLPAVGTNRLHLLHDVYSRAQNLEVIIYLMKFHYLDAHPSWISYPAKAAAIQSMLMLMKVAYIAHWLAISGSLNPACWCAFLEWIADPSSYLIKNGIDCCNTNQIEKYHAKVAGGSCQDSEENRKLHFSRDDATIGITCSSCLGSWVVMQIRLRLEDIGANLHFEDMTKCLKWIPVHSLKHFTFFLSKRGTLNVENEDSDLGAKLCGWPLSCERQLRSSTSFQTVPYPGVTIN